MGLARTRQARSPSGQCLSDRARGGAGSTSRARSPEQTHNRPEKSAPSVMGGACAIPGIRQAHKGCVCACYGSAHAAVAGLDTQCTDPCLRSMQENAMGDTPKRTNERATGNRAARTALRDFALGLPGAYEEFPWGECVVKVNKKVFVFLGIDTDHDTGL